MRRLFIIVLGCLLVPPIVQAQPRVLEAGDPPVASLVTISPPDENNQVTITGAAGAVFPAAQVAVRNLYTGDTVYAPAGITGQFSATLTGQGNTPFWVSPASALPPDVRTPAGSVPGGPGTILYAPFPENRRQPVNPITQIVLDGLPADWNIYPNTTLGNSADGLRNLDSAYIQLRGAPADYQTLRFQLQVNEVLLEITLDPGQNVAATWQRLGSTPPTDLGTVGVAAINGEVIELRVPLESLQAGAFNSEIAALTLVQVDYLDVDGNVLRNVAYDAPLSPVTENDGITYPESALGENPLRFNIAGAVAGGAATWTGRVRMNTLTLSPGETLLAEMDVSLDAPGMTAEQVGVAMIGRWSLQPVALADDFVTSATPDGNNGWSTYLTPSGLPVTGLTAAIALGEVRVPPQQVIYQDGTLHFGMPVALTIPDDLPPGVYVPAFEGFAQIGDGDTFRWSDNGVFGAGERETRPTPTRLPAVLNIGREANAPIQTLWTLFHAQPSDGSLGIVPLENRGHTALANRVRFNSPTHIIEPGTDAPLEPYLVNVMPNAYGYNTAPLLPLLYPSGRMSMTIRRPDGGMESLPGTPIVQNVLSTTTIDERDTFGASTPLDVYRLTTLNAGFTAPILDVYGEYTVELTGFVEDVWGNRYEGGGTYPFIVAERLDMTPMMLSGTPYEVGDHAPLGLHIAPGVAASVAVTARLYPLDGSPVVERLFAGAANDYGVFTPPEPWQMTTPGEYVIDYEARYTDAQGRLWAGSLRTAGVVAGDAGPLLAHGGRGLSGVETPYRPAWYLADNLTNTEDTGAQLYAPYHHGDVLWVPDGAANGVQPTVTVQDRVGDYAAWLTTNQQRYTNRNGQPIERLAATDALPAVLLDDSAGLALAPAEATNIAYTYLSYVTPAVTARQVVVGREPTHDDLLLDMDDPLLGQIGAGAAGLRPGDTFFMFGGAVVRNTAQNVQATAIYGALGVVTDADDERGARVFPPYRGAAGGPDGGPLYTRDNTPVDIFFQPTGALPGDVLRVGDTLTIAGQVGPPLASDLTVTITSPAGSTEQFTGRANAVGSYYNPDFDLTVDEPGVWSVQVAAAHRGTSSAGQRISTSPPTGTQTYNVYVLREDAARLPWEDGAGTAIPFPTGFPRNFNFDLPDGWTEVRAYLTVTLPGAVVTDGEIQVQGTALRYQLNPTTINTRFPFYEGQDGRLDGPASSDPVRLTFAFTGLNADGEFDVLARQVAVRHDRLLTIE